MSVGELERLAKAESQRLETEEKMNLKGAELKDFLANYNKKVAGEEEKIDDKGSAAVRAESAPAEDEEDMDPLADLLGDDIPVSASSGFDPTGPSAKADAKPPRAPKREREPSESTEKKKKVKTEEEATIVPQISIV